jgi:uncharacterized membrane protein
MKRSNKIHLVAMVGMAAALYALHVEAELAAAPPGGYKAACDLNNALTRSLGISFSCTKVFSSSYGHILSHWGLVPRGHPLDISLALSGIILYSAYFFYPILRFIPMRQHLFFAVACAGGCFSLYLLYILKVVLGDFCIVCMTFHTCNFCMLALARAEWKAPEPAARMKKRA